MGRSRHQQKVIKYIRQDRPKRLETYVKKHKLDLTEIVLEGGGNLLHICCAVSSGPVLRYLLKEEVAPLHKDGFGNLPLHILIQRAIDELNKGDNSYATVYEEMILPYTSFCPTALQQPNKAGKTAQTLLDGFVCKCEQLKDQQNFAGPSNEDSEWDEKLRDESHNEHYMNGGRYEEDFLFTSSAASESYDDWAERLVHEHGRKHRNAYTHTQRPAPPLHRASAKSSSAKSSSEEFRRKHEEYQEKLKKEREKMKRKYKGHEAVAEEGRKLLQRKRLKYEEHFSELTKENSSVKKLGYDDIPWPHTGSVAMVMDVLFVDQNKTDKRNYKKYLRDQIFRWHPDKFEQKFGQSLKETEKEKILNRVKEISQALNSKASSESGK